MPVSSLFPPGGGAPDPDAAKATIAAWRAGCDAKLAAGG